MIVSIQNKSVAMVRRYFSLISAFIFFLCTLVVAAQSKPTKQAGWSVWKPVGRLPTARFRWKSVTDSNGLECLVEVTTRIALPSTHDLVISYNYESGDQINSQGVDVMTTSWDSFIHLDARLSAQQPIQINTSGAAQYNCLSVRRVVSMPPRPQWHEPGETPETSPILKSQALSDNLAMKTATFPPQSVAGGNGSAFVSFVYLRHDSLQYGYPENAGRNDDSDPEWTGAAGVRGYGYTHSSYFSSHECDLAFESVDIASNQCVGIDPPYTVTYRTWDGETKTTGATGNTALTNFTGEHLFCGQGTSGYGNGSIRVTSSGSLGTESGYVSQMYPPYYTIYGCRSIVTVTVPKSQIFECGNGNPQGCNYCWPVGSPNPCNQQPGGNIAH
jgi:hypothetical protein